jgi:sulfate/thiosulfate transport system substrate-binding protein
MHRHMRFPKLALAALVATAMVAVGCGGASDSTSGEPVSSDSSNGEVSLVAYSTPEVVYDEIIPAFNESPDGEGIGFKTSYGASGDQSRAVEAGQPADYVSFSTEPDMTRLVDAGLVDPNWKQQTEYDGLVNTSLVSFVVRKGNPKDIHTWDDLVKPGVEVLTPNPFTSGAAKWNLLGAYGAAGGAQDPQKGLDYLDTLLNKNVVAQDKSGRDALQNFLSGTGDVLISYEYEAITAQKQGEEDVELVIPEDSTTRIDIDAAVTKDAPPEAQKFHDFVLSDAGQQAFAEWGYRPVNKKVLAEHKDQFPDPKGELLTIEDFGGWEKANELFDLETDGAIAKLEEATGIPTED